jgi:hypothetical protein
MVRKNLTIISLISILVLVCVVVLPFSVQAEGINTGPYTWSLDSKNDKDAKLLPSGVSQMEKNYGTGDNGQSGKIIIASGKSFIWISDQLIENDITVSSGAWILQIITDSDWGTKGNKCQIEIGEWNGKFKSLTPPPQDEKTWGAPTVVVKTLFQSESLTIGGNKYLAIRVTNLSSKSHTIYTGEKGSCSFLRSPETYTTTPLPELSSAILLTIGLAGLAAFVVLKRKSLA